MLVLTRKKREGILMSEGQLVLGDKDNILIRIIDIQGDRIRIGIEAPRNYQIAREELLTREVKSDAAP